jgi:hypothetical protein
MSALYAGIVMWSDVLMLGTEDILIGALVAIVVVFILAVVVNNRPDPKAILLLNLLANLPREAAEEKDESDLESNATETAPHPRGHEFFT